MFSVKYEICHSLSIIKSNRPTPVNTCISMSGSAGMSTQQCAPCKSPNDNCDKVSGIHCHHSQHPMDHVVSSDWRARVLILYSQ